MSRLLALARQFPDGKIHRHSRSYQLDSQPWVHPRYGKLIDAPYIDHIPLEETTIAHLLKSGGYDTWHVGKWHLGNEEYYPDKVGFDVNIGGCHWGRPRNGYVMPCGIKNPKENNIDGMSLMPLLEQKSDLPERPIFWHYPHYSDPGGTPAAIVMLGNFKLIEFFEDMHTELYDLYADPSELNNLVSEMPEKTEKLKALLHNWQASVNIKIPEINPNYI